MLSEHHDINDEFPDFTRKINELRASDTAFDALVARHDFLDDEIRRLEELQSPSSDDEMKKMKSERDSLKDQVFETLRASCDRGS